MIRFIWPLALLLCLGATCKKSQEAVATVSNGEYASLDRSSALETIAFGSCNRQDLPQPMWTPILSHQPDLWIWLGDNIYGDTEDMEVFQSKYAKQMSNGDYRKLLASTPVLGIWDDHDFGANNAGKEYPKKKETKELMLDFLGVSGDAPERNREGAYSSRLIGPKGQRVRIILLDSRYFRDQPVKKDRKYIRDPKQDILGDAQWEWLSNLLRKKDAEIVVIGNGIQIIPEDHRFEKWANFPTARARLLKMIDKNDLDNVWLLSGDRHIGEFSMMQTKDGHVVREITSSGLTHAYEKLVDEPNRHRQGPFISAKNFGLMLIDWDKKTVRVELRNENNGVHHFLENSF